MINWRDVGQVAWGERAAGGLAFALLLAGCGEEGRRPVDGGLALSTEPVDAEAERTRARDPCWRREPGGWHLSIGHCRDMLPAETMTGVWVTAFEESSFFRDAAAPPDSNDKLRYTTTLEIDEALVERRAGRVTAGAHGNAFAVTFVGRRTKDPLNVDCYGTPYYQVVVDRLLAARHLGAMTASDPPPPPGSPGTRPSGVARRHRGVWGELEAEAVERCKPSG